MEKARRNGRPRGLRSRTGRVYADLSRPQEDLRFFVHEAQHGARLDRYLAERVGWRSRTGLQRLIEEGRVLVNERTARKPAQRVFCGDRVLVRVPRPAEPLRLEEIPLEAVYEDAHILALNKPPGLVCHPVGKIRFHTLINALHARYRNLEVPALDRVPRLCHRLDRETSGLLLVALAPGVRRRMQWIFESKKVVKDYLAVVQGLCERDYEEIDLPIGPAEGSAVRIARGVNPQMGAPARTIVCVEERFEPAGGDVGFTLVRCSPVTGRQHQIRVHLAARGHPVLGDRMYGPERLEFRGFPPECPVIRRHALHALRIQFPHPITGEELDLVAPLPKDFERLLAYLRARAPRRPEA